MSNFLKNIIGGGGSAAQSPIAAGGDDSDFVDFAAPVAPSHAAASLSSGSSALSAAATATAQPNFLTPFSNPAFIGVPISQRPFTKWYHIWERVTPADFYTEVFIAPFILLIILVHTWGSRANKRKVRAWTDAHVPVMKSEFARVGIDPKLQSDSDSTKVLRSKSASEFITYATGRQNVAFVDIRLNVHKRFNPMARFGEEFLGFFFEGQPAPRERMEATAYVFDGKESEMVPELVAKQQLAKRTGESFKPENYKSSYDNFVFAIVHKDSMKQLRDSRYDLSLTTTKDHAKLPVWATVMTESAEVSDAILTPELIRVIEAAGSDIFEALIISDQPNERPTKISETVPHKRLLLSLKLPRSNDFAAGLPIFKTFLRLPDTLASLSKFRPEALRRIKATRDEEIRKIKKADEDERSEERRLKLEKDKKEERDRKLNSLTAEEQRKFLERERALDIRRSQKQRSVKAR